jgi:predicted nucleic acid-binding protein
MKPRVYVETSVISYLAARPSTDILVAARQAKSFELWQSRDALGLCISAAVREEAALGDALTAQTRLAYCAHLPVIAVTEHAEAIAQTLIKRKAVPNKAYTDALHIGIAASHGVTFIASWNFKHIAGAAVRHAIERVLHDLDLPNTAIATPEEILESF